MVQYGKDDWKIEQEWFKSGAIQYLTENYRLYRPGKTLARIYDASAAVRISEALGIPIEIQDKNP